MIETALHALLSDALKIPVYPLTLPPKVTLPACVYQRVSTAPEYSHQGDSRLERIRWQIDLWATTYGAARELAQTLREALSGYREDLTDDHDVYLCVAFIVGQRDLYEPEPRSYRASVDVSMWVRTVTE